MLFDGVHHQNHPSKIRARGSRARCASPDTANPSCLHNLPPLSRPTAPIVPLVVSRPGRQTINCDANAHIGGRA